MVKQVQRGGRAQIARDAGGLGRKPRGRSQAESTYETRRRPSGAIARGDAGAAVGRSTRTRNRVVPPLEKAELKAIAGKGGAGLKGAGTLKGELTLVRGRPLLITANKGKKDEVHFRLDLPVAKAEALAGKTLHIAGELKKETDTDGRIVGAKVVVPPKVQRPGDHVVIVGRAVNRLAAPMAVDGLPPGTYVRLAQPLQVGNTLVKELRLWNDAHPDGVKVHLSGRLDRKEYGGLATKKGEYFELSGTSDLGLGEPRFDGKAFKDLDGEQLISVKVEAPPPMLAPAQLLVLNPTQRMAFIGAWGGRIPQWVNPFHGFMSTTAIRDPHPEEVARFKVVRGKGSMDGKVLVRLGDKGPEGGEPPTEAHFLDRATATVYQAGLGRNAQRKGPLKGVIKFPAE